jgi:hypothetical protein
MAARRDVERFADREQADRQRRHLDAVEQFGMPNASRACPVSLSMPISRASAR